MSEDMTHDRFERADADYTADTFGLTPGCAGVYMEHQAEVFCKDCARDMLGDDLFDQLKQDDLGYDHPKVDEYGNVAVVLSTEEWDCSGASCGHCGISLDVRVIHYDGVCRPETCPDMTAEVSVRPGSDDTCEVALLEHVDGRIRVMFRENCNEQHEPGDFAALPESRLR